MRSSAALFLLLLASSVSPQVTVPLKKHSRIGSHHRGIAETDRAHIAALLSQTDGSTTIPVTELSYSIYTASVGVGDPPTLYNLLVDTGSSTTFVGTGTKYKKTSTSYPTGNNVSARYGSGYFRGIEYLDRVTLAPGLVIKNQSIGDALNSSGFSGFDGILGFGPADLTLHNLSPDKNSTIPTVMNNLVVQNLIKNQVLGVHFAPATSDNDTNGALTFGGIDTSLFVGDVTYTPITKTHPSSLYWGINTTSITNGNDTIICDSAAGIVDTGTSLIGLSSEAFKRYIKPITGAKMNATVGVLEIPASSIKNMRPLSFKISGREFVLDVAAQLTPQDENTAVGGEADKHYGVVFDLEALEGVNFVLGMKFMEMFYTVFDTDNKRVGFAESKNTFTDQAGCP